MAPAENFGNVHPWDQTRQRLSFSFVLATSLIGLKKISIDLYLQTLSIQLNSTQSFVLSWFNPNLRTGLGQRRQRRGGEVSQVSIQPHAKQKTSHRHPTLMHVRLNKYFTKIMQAFSFFYLSFLHWRSALERQRTGVYKKSENKRNVHAK